MSKMKSAKSFSELSTLLENANYADNELFARLSDPHTSSKVKERQLLEGKVASILLRMDEAYNVNSGYYGLNCDSCCRNLAAYLLAFSLGGRYFKQVFASIIDLLEFYACPKYRKDLRTIRRKFNNEYSKVVSVGFDWKDLDDSFHKDKFCESFLRTEVVVEAKPKVVYVEREVVKEVEKEVIKEVTKVVEVTPLVDPYDFGVEDQHTEFKSSFFVSEKISDELQRKNVCKAVCAFLNADGGKIYIGVNDSGQAFPKYIDGFAAGIEKEISYLSRRGGLPFGKNNVDSYCIAIKRAIESEFMNGNDTSKFMNGVIVEETIKNDNVVVIDVKPSRYAVVRLDGIAYQRSGAESRQMDETQVRQRKFELGKEIWFKDIIKQAIREKRQMMLYSYESNNSRTVCDRFVEPVNLVCGEEAVICFDIDKMATRQFKISRIGDVKLLTAEWQYEARHEVKSTDIFGWTAQDRHYKICLDLNLKAKTTLLEAHPSLDRNLFVKTGDNVWRIKTVVYSLEPVISFFLSMADCVDICESQDSGQLKSGIMAYVRNFVMTKCDN